MALNFYPQIANNPSPSHWKKKYKELEQEKNQLTRTYEDILMQYTKVFEEKEKYKQLYLDLKSRQQSMMGKGGKIGDNVIVNQLQQENHVLKIKNNQINMLQNDTDINSKYNELYQQFNEIKHENQSLQTLISKMKKGNKENKAQIEQLKKDLSSAQSEILEMSNIVGVKQNLPTVQETLSIFHNIRDQQHHNTCTKLRKYIKSSIKGKKYQKYYINQIIHKLMFETLSLCQEIVNQYKLEMFVHISNQLNMDNALKCVYYDDYDVNQGLKKMSSEDQGFIDSERDKILNNRLGSFLRENYKYILRMDQLKKSVLEKALNDNPEFKAIRDSGNEEVYIYYNEYVTQCIEVCWVMILQEPVLNMRPLKWTHGDGQQPRRYDDDQMKRVLGSDRKCSYVLYYVWPNLMRNGSILKNQKMEVITKAEMYTPIKIRNKK